MNNNRNEIVEKMIKVVEEIVKENDKEQFDSTKQNSVNKTIAKSVIAELDKVIENEN